jgi:hypothetical protein
MPNWCNNYLFISGPKKVIKEIADTQLSLQKILPCPQELLDTTSPAEQKIAEINTQKYGSPDWYSWQIAHWGTKWDIGPIDCHVYEDSETGNLEVNFDSAWSPPVAAMEFIFNKYDAEGINLRMEYIEPGCAFAGVCEGGPGTEFEDNNIDYSDSQELSQFAEDEDHEMARGEVEYMREREAEEAAEKEPTKKPTKKPTKTSAKPATKNPVKKSAKKPVVKKLPAKKPAKKVAAKPAKAKAAQAKKAAKKPKQSR